MRRFLAGLAGLSIAAALTAAEPPADVARIAGHVRTLAADDMRGRANGSPELEKAADYIAAQFKSIGLRPGWNAGYKQPFDLVAGVRVGTNTLTVRDGSTTVTLKLGESYFPIGTAPGEDASKPSAELKNLPLVFAGYGLSAPDSGYDDYADRDVSGKAVLVFSHEPQERDRNSKLNGARPMRETTVQAKAAAAAKRGAKVLLVVADPSHDVDDTNYRLFSFDPDTEAVPIPVLRVRRTEMEPLVREWGIERLARLTDRDLVPRGKELDAASIDYVEQLWWNRRTVHNVIGILPGSDRARADEVVVIGAHYDHVGLGGRYSMAPDRTGEIHNGADDNASGTAAVIEMARAALATRTRFPRTLIFMTFAGEERGLLGSQHYVEHPTLPIERTVAMINLDMVGRARGGVDVSGLEVSKEIERAFAAASKETPLRVRHSGPGAGRSDDSSFASRQVPAINFFTGFHDDYHRPGDDPEKLDAEGTARIAALALEFAAQLAAAPASSRPR